MVAESSPQVCLSKIGFQISTHRQIILVETARYPKSEPNEAPSGSNVGTPLASVSNTCFVKNMRLLAAALEEPRWHVHEVFQALFEKRVDDATQLSHSMRGWGTCLVPLDHPKLQGSSVLHLVAGQPPPWPRARVLAGLAGLSRR